MPYCINCGQQYTQPQKYCRQCGRNTTTAPGSFASDSADASTRSLAYERSYWHLRRQRRDARDSNDSLELFVRFLAVIAFIHGMSLFLGPAIGNMLAFDKPLIWLLIAGILLGAGLKIAFDIRYGYSVARSLLEVLVVGLVCYGFMFGSMWYLRENVLRPDKPLFNLTLIVPAKPTPKLESNLSPTPTAQTEQ